MLVEAGEGGAALALYLYLPSFSSIVLSCERTPASVAAPMRSLRTAAPVG